MREPSEEQPTGQSPGGLRFAEQIKDSLSEQRAVKESLERRGVAMVQASAFLTAFVLSLLSFTFKNVSELSTSDRYLVWAAILGFLVAALLGLVINAPRGYSEATLETLRHINEQQYWDTSEEMALRRINESRLKTIGSYMRINKQKAWTLLAALICETVGIGALAWLILALIT